MTAFTVYKERFIFFFFRRVHVIQMFRSLLRFSPTTPLWKLGKLNHVAIAVPNLQQAADFYKNVLGAKVSESVALPDHGVYTVFVDLGNSKLELLHPLGEKSPIAKFLQKNAAGGLHHVCLEVEDIHQSVADLTKKGIRALDPEPKIGAHGKLVVFLHPKDCQGVLIELEQV